MSRDRGRAVREDEMEALTYETGPFEPQVVTLSHGDGGYKVDRPGDLSGKYVPLADYENLRAVSLLQSRTLKLDLIAREAYVNGQPIRLTLTESEVLACLMRKPGQAMSREEIAQAANMPYSPHSSSVAVYVNYLRKKLDYPFKHNRIQSVRGTGYRFQD